MDVVIVANAPDLDLTPYRDDVLRADYRLAADGGAVALVRAGILPDRVIGDLDSVDAATLAHLHAHRVELDRHPRAKDATDFELALLAAVELGATSIVVFGALGGRWDHTLANVALLAHPSLRGRQVRLRDGEQTLFLVQHTATITGTPGDTLSLLPLSGAAHGITTHHLLYPLENATLRYETARGISNVLMEPTAQIQVREGVLLVVQHRDDGRHQWRTPGVKETP